MELTADIIVPMYNAQATISRCLDSLLKQSNVNKIIVVDDASQDASKEIVEGFTRKSSKILLKSTQHGGPSLARNEGLKFATSPVVMFCDSDDYYFPNMVPILLSLLEKNDADIAVAGIVDVDRNGNCKSRKQKTATVAEKEKANELILFDAGVFGGVHNKAYRSDVLNGISFDTRYSFCEDTIFNLTIINKFEPKITISGKPLYAMCFNPKSITHSSDFRLKGMNAAKNLSKYSEEASISNELRQKIDAKCFSLRAFNHEKGLLQETLCDFFKVNTACHDYFFNPKVRTKEKIFTLAAILRAR